MKRLIKRSFSVLLAFCLITQIKAGRIYAETVTLNEEDVIVEDDASSILEDHPKEEESDIDSKEGNGLVGETKANQPEDAEPETVEPVTAEPDQEEELEDINITADLLTGNVFNVGTLSELQTAWGKINASSGETIINITGNISLGSQVFTVPAGASVTVLSENSYLLTKSSGRHFYTNGNLTLANVILDGIKSGGGIQVNGGGRLYMEDGSIIQKCSAVNGGGVYLNNGELILNAGNAYIKGNTTTADGAGVYMAGNSNFIMNNGNITDNIARTASGSGWGSGGGVYMSGGSSFTMKGGSITNNTARSGSGSGFAYGGGVYVGTECNFLMEGGTINQNTAAKGGAIGYGGGVYMNGDTFTMNNGSNIEGNYAGYGLTGFGGGVYVNSGTFKMNTGSSLSGNYASSTSSSYGGGVYVNRTNYEGEDGEIGKFILNGGSIDNNKAANGGGMYINGDAKVISGRIFNNNATNGGGAYVNKPYYENDTEVNGSLTLKNGSLENNNATNGGGAFVTGTLEIQDGTVKNNTATNGGGIYVSHEYYYYDYESEEYSIYNGTFTMTDGSVLSNRATAGGGGIYTKDYGYVSIAENVAFNDNKASRLAVKVSGADQAVHEQKILTSSRSEETEYLYNNYDVNYVNYVVTFYDDNGTTVLNQYTVLTGDSVALPEGPLKYYKFNKWVPQSYYYTLDSLSNVTQDMGFKASYTTEVNRFTVTFESNGGSDVETKTVNYGGYVMKPDVPELAGYILEGWYQDEDLEVKWDFESDTVTKDMTLYAKWAEEITDGNGDENNGLDNPGIGDGGNGGDNGVDNNAGGNGDEGKADNGSNNPDVGDGGNDGDSLKIGGGINGDVANAKNSNDEDNENGDGKLVSQLNGNESVDKKGGTDTNNNEDGGDQSKKSESPQTGDSNPIMLWIGTLLISSAFVVMLLVRYLESKKKKVEN